MAKPIMRSRSQRDTCHEPQRPVGTESNIYLATQKKSPLQPVASSVHTEVTAQPPAERPLARSKSQVDRSKPLTKTSGRTEGAAKVVKRGPAQEQGVKEKGSFNKPHGSPREVARPQIRRKEDQSNGRAPTNPQGSRTMAPQGAPSPHRQSDQTISDSGSHGAGGQRTRPPMSHKNSTKWKLFGGFFGKKSEDLTPPASSRQVLPQPSPLSSQDEKSPLNKKLPTPPASPDAQRPHLSRSRSKIDHSLRTAGIGSRPHIKRSKTETTPISNEPQMMFPPLEAVNAKSPLLQVDIPNIEMERYSVMFSGLLKPAGSSLLARRQATLDRLKTTSHSVEQDSPPLTQHDQLTGLKQPSRRATSPAATSPSFSLFPPGTFHLTPAATPSSRKPSPLQRSQTAPVEVLSPPVSSSTFGGRRLRKPQDEKKLIVVIQSPAGDSVSQPEGTALSELSKLSCSSPGSEDTAAASDHASDKPNRPGFSTSNSSNMPSPSEPAWEMITQSARQKRAPRAPGDATDEAEALIRSAADASIARQITVSQRQLLLPIAPSAERVVDRKPMTATLVELQQGPAGRKSQRIVLDTA